MMRGENKVQNSLSYLSSLYKCIVARLGSSHQPKLTCYYWMFFKKFSHYL